MRFLLNIFDDICICELNEQFSIAFCCSYVTSLKSTLPEVLHVVSEHTVVHLKKLHIPTR